MTETDRLAHPRILYTRARARACARECTSRTLAIDRSARAGKLGCRKLRRRVELRLCTRIRECSGSFGLLVTFAVGARVRRSSLPVCLSIRLSVRPSVGRSVRCLPQRTSDECIAVWPRPEGSLTDYHLVFMVFEVLLNHLAASLLRVRLPSFPPSSPNVPSRPRCRRRWRRHGVHRGP